MQRIAAIFTLLVFAALLGGLLSRSAPVPPAALRDFEPPSPPELPVLVDPLGAVRDPAQARADRLSLRVVDPAGKPFAGAALVVRSGDSTLWAFTAADGGATLDGLAGS